MSVYERPREFYRDRWYSDRVFKVFMGLTTAPTMAFALAHLIQPVWNLS